MMVADGVVVGGVCVFVVDVVCVVYCSVPFVVVMVAVRGDVAILRVLLLFALILLLVVLSCVMLLMLRVFVLLLLMLLLL